jgi:hypothetical protein
MKQRLLLVTTRMLELWRCVRCARRPAPTEVHLAATGKVVAVEKQLEKAEVLLRLKEWQRVVVPTEVHLQFTKAHLEAAEAQLTPAETPLVSTEACPYKGERADSCMRPECRGSSSTTPHGWELEARWPTRSAGWLCH